MRNGLIRTVLVGAIGGSLAAGIFVGVGAGSAYRPGGPEVKAVVDASGPGARSADFARAKGRPDRSVYVVHVKGSGRVVSLLCVWDAAPDGSNEMGGCNPETNPFGGHQAFVNFTAEGGPPPDHPVTDARISGVAGAKVASLSVTMSDGSSRPVELAKRMSGGYRAFAFRASDDDLAAAVTPVEVVVRNTAGAVIDTVPTGFPAP
ncbi:MAG: hypothetical protein ACXVZW_10685 [Gaiellaceae bacterium]